MPKLQRKSIILKKIEKRSFAGRNVGVTQKKYQILLSFAEYDRIELLHKRAQEREHILKVKQKDVLRDVCGFNNPPLVLSENEIMFARGLAELEDR